MNQAIFLLGGTLCLLCIIASATVDFEPKPQLVHVVRMAHE